MKHPWRRLLAWFVDCPVILVWVGITAAIGIPLYLAGVLNFGGQLTLNIVGAVVVIVPSVLAISGLESGRHPATIGKRVMKLRVEAAVGRLSFRRALLRNALKIALPWTIGHATVFALVSSSSEAGPVSPDVAVLLVAAYLFPVVYIAALFVRRGRTPYDFASHTHVSTVDATGRESSRVGTGKAALDHRHPHH